MPSDMGPPHEPCPSSSSRKRKQPDEDEELLLNDGTLREDPIENEYEDLDDEEDLEDNDDEITVNRKKAEYESMLKAQEPSTISQYGDIKITPFNLVEELEDGEFDHTGNFVFRKESPTDDDKNDTWAESVDWNAVERRERETDTTRQQQSAHAKEKMNIDDKTEPVRDRFTCYRQLLRIMRPEETVQKSIRRLGSEVPRRRTQNNKLRAQKSSQLSDKQDDQVKVIEIRNKLNLLIELAHHLLEDGDTDIYQKSYEDLEEAIN